MSVSKAFKQGFMDKLAEFDKQALFGFGKPKEDPVVFETDPLKKYPELSAVANDLAADTRYTDSNSSGNDLSHWLLDFGFAEDGDDDTLTQYTDTAEPVDEKDNPWREYLARLAKAMRKEKVKSLLLEISHNRKNPGYNIAVNDQVKPTKTHLGTSLRGLYFDDGGELSSKSLWEDYVANQYLQLGMSGKKLEKAVAEAMKKYK